jgi:hypothetical protein
LVELWNLVDVEGFVEYRFPRSFNHASILPFLLAQVLPGMPLARNACFWPGLTAALNERQAARGEEFLSLTIAMGAE